MSIKDFLPISKQDMAQRGWEQLDFVIVTGDAYVDHPSFGAAIISRILEREGFKVGIIAQPDWRNTTDFKRLGKPRLGWLVTSGNIDSMVNHYTAAKKHRSNDAYSPGGKGGLRPDRASVVYANRCREAYKGIPVIMGGIEASLRRFAHYDYWSDQVRRSVLVDGKADLLVYGMGEDSIKQIAHGLNQGQKVVDLTMVKGIVYQIGILADIPSYELLASYEEVAVDKEKYSLAFMSQYNNQDPIRGKTLVQPHGESYIVQTPPAMPLNQRELDAVYALPFMGSYHPSYEAAGGVPAIEEVEFSLVSSRGCFGSCSFCALTFHQGRIIQSRSKESIVNEAKNMIWSPRFKGYIHDVGGPTANFRQPACSRQLKRGTCSHRQCLFPEPCSQMVVDHADYLTVLRELRKIPGVKKVFVRSGVRYDYLLADASQEFLKELCEHHVSGQLKVAPEHISPKVLEKMGKPGRKVYDKFVQEYAKTNQNLKKEQYLVPYFMSSHPGCGLKEAVELAEYIRDMGYNPEQVQDFIPTPGTLSTCMYYTGLDPRTMEKVYVPKSPHEKAMQRALMQYRNPKNYDLVLEALRKVKREDLIGFGPKCLIHPRKTVSDKNKASRPRTGTGTERAGGSTRTKAGKPSSSKQTVRPEKGERFKAPARGTTKPRNKKG
jgi:uncharacterized radical SAM protein YgiQ